MSLEITFGIPAETKICLNVTNSFEFGFGNENQHQGNALFYKCFIKLNASAETGWTKNESND